MEIIQAHFKGVIVHLLYTVNIFKVKSAVFCLCSKSIFDVQSFFCEAIVLASILL